MQAEDVLDKCLFWAQSQVKAGEMEVAHFYKIKDRVNQLWKLELSEDHDKYHAPDVYEWLKYKVAADIGGVAEREAFEMYERM